MHKNSEPTNRRFVKLLNLPNQLTGLRLILSVILFGLIAWEQYLASFIMFVIAAGTDWLDGYFARKYGQVTTLGRILDPFADKVIVCGTFIFLTAIPAMHPYALGIAAVDGRCDRGARIAGHGLAKLPGRSRRRFFRQDVGQVENGAAVRGGGLVPLRLVLQSVHRAGATHGSGGFWWFRSGRRSC